MEELHEEERTEALREEEIREEPLDVQQPEESPIQPRKRRQHARSRLAAFFAPIAAYYASIGKDVKWYFDIRLWSPLIVVLLILALLVGKGPDKPVVETTPETEAQVMETEPETTAPAEPVETAKKGGGLIIGLSVVLVILCGVVGFVFLRKRFRK